MKSRGRGTYLARQNEIDQYQLLMRRNLYRGNTRPRHGHRLPNANNTSPSTLITKVGRTWDVRPVTSLSPCSTASTRYKPSRRGSGTRGNPCTGAGTAGVTRSGALNGEVGQLAVEAGGASDYSRVISGCGSWVGRGRTVVTSVMGISTSEIPYGRFLVIRHAW